MLAGLSVWNSLSSLNVNILSQKEHAGPCVWAVLRPWVDDGDGDEVIARLCCAADQILKCD